MKSKICGFNIHQDNYRCNLHNLKKKENVHLPFVNFRTQTPDSRIKQTGIFVRQTWQHNLALQTVSGFKEPATYIVSALVHTTNISITITLKSTPLLWGQNPM